MEVFIAILILLVLARGVGELMARFKQSPLIGEVLTGIIVGPSLLCLIVPTINGLDLMADLGIFFLMFLVGLEMRLEEIKKVGKHGILVAWGGVLLPFVFGFILGMQFTHKTITALFLGMCMSVTAIAVSARVLMDLGKLNTLIGRTIIAAAVIDDIIALVMLTILVGIGKQGIIDLWNVSILIIKILIFIGIIFIIDKLVKLRYGLLALHITHYLRKFRTKEAEFAISLIVGLLFAILAEWLGLHFVLGAFFAGLLIHDELIGTKAYQDVVGATSKITLGFVAPIFFAFVGLLFNFQALIAIEYIYLLLAVLLVATIGKVCGAMLGAKLSGLPLKDGLTIGIAMNGRMAVELVLISIGLELGIISQALFSIIVLMVFVTTISTPIILRWLFTTTMKP
jgi:Kef-type K+ transport system membrane component KefB